jgi:hypothetical protein
MNGARGILYDSKLHGETKLFRGHESFIYKGNEQVGDQARGALTVEAEGLLKVNR